MRIIGLGVLPSLLVAFVKVDYPTWGKGLMRRLGLIVASLALILLPVVAFSSHYASFFRVHKPLRSYVNPIMPIYSVGKLASIEYKKPVRQKIPFITPKTRYKQPSLICVSHA